MAPIGKITSLPVYNLVLSVVLSLTRQVDVPSTDVSVYRCVKLSAFGSPQARFAHRRRLLSLQASSEVLRGPLGPEKRSFSPKL